MESSVGKPGKKTLLNWAAHFVSLIVHPLWWPTYGLYILLTLNPYLFGVGSASGQSILMLQVFMLTFTLPLVSILMLKKLSLISSYDLNDRLDRTGPYIVTLIFYLWLYINIRHDPKVPLVYNIFVFGALITLVLVFMINLFIKLSAHTAVMGGLVAMTWITFNVFSHEQFSLNIPGQGLTILSWRSVLITSLLIGGLVGTCRLYLKAHTPKEVYLGYLVGFVAQYLAFKILF
ncbi:MAG: hypothetical protein IPJ09_18385 [Saprospiraceae bacterium]|nr:hypothetical protein [Saprospiraceae bacterium]